jgi:cytoskeletal protein CcmA (bactofilin family)
MAFKNFRKPTDTVSKPTPSYSDAPVPSDWQAPVAPVADVPAQNSFFDPTPAEPSPFEPAPSTAGMGVATRNVLNSDVAVVGILRFTDDLLVDGTVEGEITSDGELTVGANAVIQAGPQTKVAVRTRSAIIQGRVTGDIVVTDRVELTSTAELVGDVTASKISIQEGAVFIGHCMVGVASASAVQTPAPAKKIKTAKTPTNNNLLS